MHVQVYIDGKLVLDGRGNVEEEFDDQVELVVETENGEQFIVQVPEL